MTNTQHTGNVVLDEEFDGLDNRVVHAEYVATCTCGWRATEAFMSGAWALHAAHVLAAAENDALIAKLEGMIVTLDTLVMNVETTRGQMQGAGNTAEARVRDGLLDLVNGRRKLATAVAEMVA